MKQAKLVALVLLILLAANGARAKAQSLDGVWDITAVIDNGRVIEPTEVLQKYAADGRVVIRGQQVELPGRYEGGASEQLMADRPLAG